MNGPIIMYGPGISAARMPAPETVRKAIEDFARANVNARLADIEKKLKDALDRIDALERKSKRGRRRK